MHSKQALILALMMGAGGLLFALGGLLSIEFLDAAEPYLNGDNDKIIKTKDVNAPQIITKLDGTLVQIVELNDDGNVARVVHTSDLNDQVADFGLFAIPQTSYSGKIYVQSLQDAANGTLIIYPLDVATGKISAATINTTSSEVTLSPEQNRVASINTSPASNITAYDLATGTVLASWTLAANERLSEGTGYVRTYTGSGVRWTSNFCFDHAVWVSNVMELRTFCIEEAAQ